MLSAFFHIHTFTESQDRLVSLIEMGASMIMDNFTSAASLLVAFRKNWEEMHNPDWLILFLMVAHGSQSKVKCLNIEES